MAKAVAAEKIDPDLQIELIGQLQKEIDAIVAGGTGTDASGAQSKDGKPVTVRQVKRLGEGINTPLDKNPGQMGKPPKSTK